MAAILEIKNIETWYEQICVLRGLSFAVEQGKITAILGTNGAGKTTLLNTVMGLIKNQPEKGSILFRGKSLEKKDTDQIVKSGISCVPEGRQIFEELTLLENLKLGAWLRRDRAEVEKDLLWIFELFPQLLERCQQYGGTLSGGEQQMLALGRALMASPSLLLLDEPTLGLSPRWIRDIFRVIQKVHQQGTTILLVEQNAKIALEIADDAYILENGHFVLKGSAQDLLENPDVGEFYLGTHQQESIKGSQRWKHRRTWA